MEKKHYIDPTLKDLDYIELGKSQSIDSSWYDCVARTDSYKDPCDSEASHNYGELYVATAFDDITA